MICKTIEIRDEGTFIPALAVKLEPSNERDRYLLSRAGFGRLAVVQGDYVVLTNLQTSESSYDPFTWSGRARTMPKAHLWLVDHFDEIESGAVVDVEFILGETTTPKRSEQTEN